MINFFFKLAVNYLYKNRIIAYSYNIYNMYGLHHVKKIILKFKNALKHVFITLYCIVYRTP